MRQPAVYRRRPVQIEAMRFTRDNAELVAAWCGGLLEDDGTAIVLRLGTSIVRAGLGDWVARGTYPIVIGLPVDEYVSVKGSGLPVARAKPGELTLGSGGPGSSLHIAFEVLKRAAGVEG